MRLQVDVETNRACLERFDIQFVPAIFFYHKGRLLQLEGAVDTASVRIQPLPCTAVCMTTPLHILIRSCSSPRVYAYVRLSPGDQGAVVAEVLAAVPPFAFELRAGCAQDAAHACL